jgi:hypothetical protein
MKNHQPKQLGQVACFVHIKVSKALSSNIYIHPFDLWPAVLCRTRSSFFHHCTLYVFLHIVGTAHTESSVSQSQNKNHSLLGNGPINTFTWRHVSWINNLSLGKTYGFKYLHRDPASRRRRRKGTSQIWDSKICPRVPRDSDPRKTMLKRASNIYQRQTSPLVREGAPQKLDRNCQRVIKIWSWAPYRDLLIDWSSVAMWLWHWLW